MAKLDTITNNEDRARLEVFEGRLPLPESGAELIRVMRAQLVAAEDRARTWMDRAVRAEMELARRG